MRQHLIENLSRRHFLQGSAGLTLGFCLPAVSTLATAAEAGPGKAGAGLPSICTVQAPQSAWPQPYLVPVISSVSRSTQSRGVSGSTSTEYCFPLMVS